MVDIDVIVDGLSLFLMDDAVRVKPVLFVLLDVPLENVIGSLVFVVLRVSLIAFVVEVPHFVCGLHSCNVKLSHRRLKPNRGLTLGRVSYVKHVVQVHLHARRRGHFRADVLLLFDVLFDELKATR